MKVKKLMKLSFLDTLEILLPKLNLRVSNLFRVILYIIYFFWFSKHAEIGNNLGIVTIITYVILNFVIYALPLFTINIILNIPSVFIYHKVDRIVEYVGSVFEQSSDFLQLNDDLSFNYRKTLEMVKNVNYSNEVLNFWIYYLETTKLRISLISAVLTSLLVIYVGYFEGSSIILENDAWSFLRFLLDPTAIFVIKLIGLLIMLSSVSGKIMQINHTKERINLILRMKSN